MKLKVSLLIFLVVVALAACVDIPDFSDTPVIFYNGISNETRTDTVNNIPQETEVVTVTINFEDGDGDLGASNVEVQDTIVFTKQYLDAPNWNLEGNYELVTMIKQKDGSWTETILTGDKFKFFPRLKLDGKDGPIKGKLDLNARFPKSRSTVPTTVKYKVRIMDRAFRASNQIMTDTIVVPLLP